MVKLSIMPSVIPSGRRCPPFPATDEDKTIGKSGQIHGARIVTRPDKNAKSKSIMINVEYTF